VDSSFGKLSQKQKSRAAHRSGLYGTVAQGIPATKGGVNVDIKEMKKDYTFEGRSEIDSMLAEYNQN
jgi:hypothetical protein